MNILSGLILVQTVCKGYLQTAIEGKEYRAKYGNGNYDQQEACPLPAGDNQRSQTNSWHHEHTGMLQSKTLILSTNVDQQA